MTAETLRGWVRRAEIDGGGRPGRSQYTSFAFAGRLLDAGINASVGNISDGCERPGQDHDRPLQDRDDPPRGTLAHLASVELATLGWVDW